MTRYTCDQMGVCKGTACPTFPHDAGLPKGQCDQAAPVRRETDAQNLLEWQNALLAQALAEQQDAEDRERMLKVLTPPRPKLKPYSAPWERTKDAIDSEERKSGNAEFLRALLICTAFLGAEIGLALWLF